ncbi:MAG: DUF1599 domain-containing protein [Chitinophagales bacterium]
MANKTSEQYDQVVDKCRQIFEKKIKDYGTSWRVLRTMSLTDQIFIKAKRVKTIEELGNSKIEEGIEEEFIGMFNYGIIALIQMHIASNAPMELSETEAMKHYDLETKQTKALMMAKNHDYGEAWRDMRINSYTDLILMKLMRLKQIEDNKGKTLISEGAESHYMDIVNYAAFGLIKLSEGQKN